jgi:hypothetical protein
MARINNLLWGGAGDPFGEREKAFLFVAVLLLFVLAGAGRYVPIHCSDQ